MTKKRSEVAISKSLAIVILSVAIIGIAVFGYYTFQHFQSSSTPTLSLNVNTTSPKLGENIRLTADSSMPITGRLILQWTIDSSSLSFQTNETMTNGVFERNFGFDKPGAWHFKVYWPGDSSYNSVYSEIESVIVTP